MSGTRPNTWMPMYWADYLADTSHLNAAEHGAYLMLIAHYWTTGKPLPNDDRLLARIARMQPDEWSNAKALLGQFFTIDEAEWRHGRIDHEIAEARARYERRAAAGREGGKQPKKAKPKPPEGGSNAKAMLKPGFCNAEAMPTQPQPQSTFKAAAADSESVSALAREASAPPPTSSPPTARDAAADPMKVGNQVLEIVGADPARWTGDFASVRAWLSWGADPEIDIYPAVRHVLCRQRKRLGDPTWRPNRLSYFDAAVEEARQNRLKPPPATDGGGKAPSSEPPAEDEDRWRKRLNFHYWLWRDSPYRETPPWDEAWGPPPDDPGCRAPRHLIEEVRAAQPINDRPAAMAAR